MILERPWPYHPVYNAASAVRKETYDYDPDMAKVFYWPPRPLANEVITELKRQKSAEGKPEDQIARNWLVQQGFIAKGSQPFHRPQKSGIASLATTFSIVAVIK
jgi:hypothetical protein